MKTCSKCGETKPRSEFFKHNQKKDGLRPDCKVCTTQMQRAYRARAKEKIRATKLEYERRWRAENPEAARAKYRRDAERWRKKNPERKKEIDRKASQKQRDQHPDREREKGRRYRMRYPERRRERVARYRAARRQQTPPWLTKEHIDEMREIYARAGPGEDVDHIWPIRGKNAWGLHVPWNLQILPSRENQSKGNKPPELEDGHDQRDCTSRLQDPETAGRAERVAD